MREQTKVAVNDVKNVSIFYLQVHLGNLGTSDHFHQSEFPDFVGGVASFCP